MRKHIVTCKQQLFQKKCYSTVLCLAPKFIFFRNKKINLQIHVTFRYFTFAVISSRKIYYAFQIRSVILCE